METPTLEVDEWLAPGSTLPLGGRTLRVLYTPGHTEDSISLLDLDSGIVFAGDFIYPGPLYAFLPNGGMGDYLKGALTLIRAAPANARVFCAHRAEPPGAPELGMVDVHDLRSALQAIRAGELCRAVGMGLAPMSVSPPHQGRGVGSQLVRHGLEYLRQSGCPYVIVLGHPEYYPRFGFEPASKCGLVSQWKGIPDEAFMVVVFDGSALPKAGGVARYRSEFDAAM